jgi:hypothetical protein
MWMAINSANVLNAGSIGAPRSFMRFADRWIFVFTAALFVVVALCGFVPESIVVVANVKAGKFPPLPPILHVHAVLMGTWLLLLLAQALLVVAGRRAVHQALGVTALVLVPAIVVTWVMLVRTAYQIAGPTIAAILIRAAIVFPVLVGWALWIRRTDPQTHKRLMLLAILVPLTAATGRVQERLGWPMFGGDGGARWDLYPLLLVLPLFVHDLIRLRHVQRAYVIWFAVNLPLAILMYVLMNSQWWVAVAPKLLGVRG